ncbi:MAG: hypothetical protein IKB38_10155 [Clostridia bacterium]|nr:hypothetical protein [Clostridia bacterium]
MKVSELKITDIKTTTDKEDLVFINVDEEPFRIYGVYRDGECYRRIPASVADRCNDFLKSYKLTTAGGRVRFVTNSECITVRVVLTGAVRKDIMTDATASGVDVYLGENYFATVKNNVIFNAGTGERLPGVLESSGGGVALPPDGVDIAFEAAVGLGDTKGQTVTLNMPVFNGVKAMYVGLKKDAEISHAPDYSLEKPIVFYGSSITHGACSSRPGMIYENQLSRELDFNYINLGFAGGAKADRAISEYIADLDMSIFVYDYDHNAPDAEYLEQTHERMFLEFRAKNPDIPVLMLSRPYGKLTADVIRRQEIIKKTYENAKMRGDENVYLVLGSEFFPEWLGGDFSVDGCHPNDIGFMYMKEAIAPTLKKMIEKVKARGVR